MIKALYGTFTIDMEPLETVDVSNKISTYVSGDIMRIPKNLVFNEVFGAVSSNNARYLQIVSGNHVHNVLEDEYVEDITISL